MKNRKGRVQQLDLKLEQLESESRRLRRKREYWRAFRSTIYAIIIVAAAAALIATLIFPIIQVSGGSMTPTLADKDLVVLIKTSTFKTGDLLGFYWQNKLLLKRVIAGPGDYVSIDENGDVYVNGGLLDEPYVTQKTLGECDMDFPYQVPDNRYFVLGDHRDVSIDSRNSSIGCIEAEQVVGRVFLKIWPINQLSIIR